MATPRAEAMILALLAGALAGPTAAQSGSCPAPGAPPPGSPPAPAMLVALQRSSWNGTIQVLWSPIPNATGYHLLMGAWGTSSMVEVSGHSLNHTGLFVLGAPPGRSVRFQVQAERAGQLSPFSSAVALNTTLPASKDDPRIQQAGLTPQEQLWIFIACHPELGHAAAAFAPWVNGKVDTAKEQDIHIDDFPPILPPGDAPGAAQGVDVVSVGGGEPIDFDIAMGPKPDAPPPPLPPAPAPGSGTPSVGGTAPPAPPSHEEQEDQAMAFGPLMAVLNPPATTYSIDVKVERLQSLPAPAFARDDSNRCGTFTPNGNNAVWDHGESTDCSHATPFHDGLIHARIVAGPLTVSRWYSGGSRTSVAGPPGDPLTGIAYPEDVSGWDAAPPPLVGPSSPGPEALAALVAVVLAALLLRRGA